MRSKTVLVLLIVAVLAALIWFSSRGEHGPALEPVRGSASENALAPALDVTPVVVPDPLASSPSEPARSEVAAATPPPESPELCIVFGRLVDEAGASIAGADVRLYGSKIWAEGFDVPRLPDRRDVRGFATSTATDGSFRFEAPVPTVARTVLAIRPDRFHDSVTLYFAESGDRMLPAIVAGERDLGEIRVARTGALTGRVIDTEGRPIADVEMGIGPTRTTTLGRDGRTGADGTYVIAHAPVGTYGVRAKAKEYLFHFEDGIVVEAGRDTQVADIVLTLAPTLEGTVVDESGRPVEGVRLWGWPVGSGGGSGASGTSGPDGRFVIPLPQTDSYTLSAKLDGYLTWGNEHDESLTYAPGRHDIEVVLRSLPRTRFTVVDAETGAPIERFGLNILEDNGSQSPQQVSTEKQPPPQKVHAAGIAEATARVGIDVYLVAADGYVLAVGDVEHDTAGVPAQTVRMQRGAGLRGRVLRDGRGLADTLVEVVRVWMSTHTMDTPSDRDRYHVTSNTRSATRTDGEGRFVLSALEGGDYRLTVRPATGAPLVLLPVNLAQKGVNDLGDLHVLAGATIVGKLIAPAGFDATGLAVVLDDRNDGVKALVDGTGGFRFENVPAGVRYLAHEGRAGVLARGDPVRVEVTAGATLEVDLFARDSAMCAVDLRIDLGDIDPKGVQVKLFPVDEPTKLETLGVCDATGRVQGSVRAFGMARVGVWFPGRQVVRHPDAEIELRALGHVEAAVRFEFARLDLRVSTALPSDGSVRVRLAPRDLGHAEQEVWVEYANGAAKEQSTMLRAMADGVSLGALIAGPHTLTVDFLDAATEPVRIDLGGGSFRIERKPYYTATSAVDLVAGKTVAVDL